ncbi:MAG: SH3 domain-containing protein [Deltaproteobacteria bacterium]|nr:SH3 domain-containing protein [Deltaproteobacteria bacterium]
MTTRWRRWSNVLWLGAALHVMAACSGSDQAAPSDPVLVEPEVGEAKVPTSDFATSTHAQESAAPTNPEAVPDAVEPPPAPIESDTGEPVALDSADVKTMDGDHAAQAPSETPPTFEEGALGAAGDDAASYLPAEGKAKGARAHHGRSASGKRGKHKMHGKNKGKAVRYVAVGTLNVRSKPSANARVVKKLKAGDEVQAHIKGQWARIGKGQWVKAKYLTKKAPGG